MTDSHAHLDMCFPDHGDIDRLIRRAADAGVTRIVTVGTDISSCHTALAIAGENPTDGVFVVAGLSPHLAGTEEADRLDELREVLDRQAAVAVGETGLDSVRQYAPLAEQRRLLDSHLELAEELDLPVVIHNREADEEIARALEPFRGTVILHCFSSPNLTETVCGRGYYASFAGNATYPKSTALREAAAAIPRDRILVETDSPYLSPQPVRGKDNEPANLVHTIRCLAEARGETFEQLAAATHANAEAAFRFPW